ncbi:hypothetical protein A2U01_0091321, partial [Trifolium medium]|nr:hypothetical protein [Trifolium medium]
ALPDAAGHEDGEDFVEYPGVYEVDYVLS